MILFISDLHLDASRPRVAEAFFVFLRDQAPRAEALYILGDLFELWVGDDDDDPFILQVQTKIKTLADSGTPVFFMHGNRDFLIGEDFARRSGVTLLDDPTTISVGEETVVLSHGDILCTKDQAYQTFRQESRSRAWFNDVMSRTLDERRQIGQQLRQQSKTMSSRKADDIMDVSDDAVESLILKHSANKLIHGHTHRPNRHHLTIHHAYAERIVLGDWDSKAWCLTYDDDWQLDSWAISEN